jgi:hypothetical protein
MKLSAILTLFILFSGFNIHAAVKDSLGLPGDNLDLQAVLTVFKNSRSVEDFEKKINVQDSKVNNLDLNKDGKVDYLRVQEYGKDNFRSLVIQDVAGPKDMQDVAVVEVEKKGSEAHVQIVGDEALYGKNYVIEPSDKKVVQSETADDVYADPNTPAVFVNVWGWPCVNYIYGPSYVFWSSPFYWGYYPSWWSPWAPYSFYYYQANVYPYHHYGWRRGYRNNMPDAHQVYAPHRTYSTNVVPQQTHHRSLGAPPRFQGQQPYYQQRPVMRQTPALRYGMTPTGGVRGGGGIMHVSGGGRPHR